MEYNQDIYRIICTLPLFEKFTDAERKKFAAEINDSIINYDVGDIIIHEGAEHGGLYLLLQGSVLVTKSGYDYIMAQLSPGAVFGEMSFFTKKPRHSNVIASDDVLAVKMDEDFFQRVHCDIKDKIKNYLIEMLIKRLDEMNASLVKIARG